MSASLPGGGVTSVGPLIGPLHQGFRHQQTRLDLVAEPLVERGDRAVRFADEQHDLGHALCREERLGMRHESAAEAIATSSRIDGDVIDPTAMPVVSDHDGPDYAFRR